MHKSSESLVNDAFIAPSFERACSSTRRYHLGSDDLTSISSISGHRPIHSPFATDIAPSPPFVQHRNLRLASALRYQCYCFRSELLSEADPATVAAEISSCPRTVQHISSSSILRSTARNRTPKRSNSDTTTIRTFARHYSILRTRHAPLPELMCRTFCYQDAS